MAPNGLKWPKNDPKWLKMAQKWHFWNVAIYAFCQAQIFCCQAPKTILHPWRSRWSVFARSIASWPRSFSPSCRGTSPMSSSPDSSLSWRLSLLSMPSKCFCHNLSFHSDSSQSNIMRSFTWTGTFKILAFPKLYFSGGPPICGASWSFHTRGRPGE